MINEPFHVNSLLALAETSTNTTTAIRKPSLGNSNPYSTTEPVIWAITFQLNLGIDWNIKNKILLKGGVGYETQTLKPYISVGIGVPLF